jgi:ATP-dependent RNA helicase RhlE
LTISQTDLSFSSLGLAEPLCRVLTAEGYSTPTPIQAQAIGPLLAGRDLLGIAQTGTGKTAAFGLPLLQRLAQNRPAPVPKTTRALILAPTRELAIQIEESLGTYGRHLGLRRAVIFGGVGQAPQVKAIARGLDILVATPGRLLDLIGQRHLRLDRVEVLVLDEADRMLDMGFVRDVRKIVQMLPRERQSLLFSATMPTDIAELARQMLKDPLRVEVTPEVITVERIKQSVHFIDQTGKRDLLVQVLRDPALRRVIVFTRTKHGADRVARHLERAGVATDAIHGDKAQGARQRALSRFRDGELRVLVATDIAARGIDVDGITHVVNFELPNVPESYVHRIGRTARAGAEGAAISFCAADEQPFLRDIERLTRIPLQRIGVGPGPARPAANGNHRPNGQRPGNHAGSHRPGSHGQDSRGQDSRGQDSRGQGNRGQGSQNPNQRAADAGEDRPKRRPFRRRFGQQARGAAA